MSDLLGPSIALIEQTMQFRVARQAVLSTNIAHIDTPGYRRTELHFDRALADAQLRLATTDARHRPSHDANDAQFRIERQRTALRPDGNGVDFDRETIRLSRNSGAFTQNAELLTRLLALRRLAITGEAR